MKTVITETWDSLKRAMDKSGAKQNPLTRDSVHHITWLLELYTNEIEHLNKIISLQVEVMAEYRNQVEEMEGRLQAIYDKREEKKDEN